MAHFDDEYCALPLLLARHRQGRRQRLLFVADYPSERVGRARFEETRALLRWLGLADDAAVHVGAGSGVRDGTVHRGLPDAWRALRDALDGEAPEEIVTPAWEGGHADHDMCALLAVALQQSLPGRPLVRQFGLYNGAGLPGPVFRACTPLRQNGPAAVVPMTSADWAQYAAAVRFYPSQAHVWSTLWPAMFARFAGHGFRWQALEPRRVRERPHPGPLLYERTGRASYGEVRACADAFLRDLR
nr:PIG-L family deacetylase [Caulobacter sp. 17J80-11]